VATAKSVGTQTVVAVEEVTMTFGEMRMMKARTNLTRWTTA
jgi:hypothetical protein